MADEFGEKTEPATPKRREQLREQGNVAKSTDLAGVMTLAGALIPMMFAISFIFQNWIGLMRRMLSGQTTSDLLSERALFGDVALAFRTAITIALPFVLIATASTALIIVAQIGLRISFEPLRPNLTKMDPVQGAKKFVDLKSAMQLVTSLAKVFLIGTVAILYVRYHFREIMSLSVLRLAAALRQGGSIVIKLILLLLVLLVILAIIDLIYQRWQFERDNRMSKQEIKEEAKSIMGDPKQKRRQREFAMQIMNQRTAKVVPEADVIVTNPEHYSIALKWDPESMDAPKVLAKGADYMALRIRQIATLNGIPIVERKPLARAMYPLVEPGQEIPAQFYTAVAEILAFVYRLEGKKVG